MKKLLLSLVAVAGIATANAQKGSILVFGNLGFNTTKDAAKDNTMSWNINPGVGYQFTDHFTVGLAGGYAMDSSFKADGGKRTSYKSFEIGAFGRYTKSLNRIFSFYGQLDAGYHNMHESYDGSKVDHSDVNGFYARLTPAIGVNVSHGFALNFSFGGLSFDTWKADFSGANTASSVDLTFGHQFNVGISKNFGGMHHKMKAHHEPMDETRHMNTSDDDDTTPKQKKAKSDDDE